jgi:hypothetical protein
MCGGFSSIGLNFEEKDGRNLNTAFLQYSQTIPLIGLTIIPSWLEITNHHGHLSAVT